jgi:hypothetical protein
MALLRLTTLAVLLNAALCLLRVTSATRVTPNYTEAWLAESHGEYTENCCTTPLDLRASFPTLSYDVTATILSRFTLVARDSQSSGTVQRCGCAKNTTTSSLEVRLGFWKVPFRYTHAAYDQQDECAQIFHKPVIILPVINPSDHFGHQMSTIVTALAAVKLHLGLHGLDITKSPVLFTYQDGPLATLNPNIRGVLLALGFANTTALDNSPSKLPDVLPGALECENHIIRSASGRCW